MSDNRANVMIMLSLIVIKRLRRLHMLALAYIFVASGLFVLVCRYAPQPLPIQNPQPIEGLFFLGCYVMGGVFGYLLPEVLAHFIGAAWADGWLERLAKVFGALSGFMIAVRGRVLWTYLFLLCVFGYIALLVIGFIFIR
jgi:hypothetical protein